MKTKKKTQKKRNKTKLVPKQTLQNNSTAIDTAVVTPPVVDKTYKYALPVKEIKKDLIKTVLYACFAIGAIVTLHFAIPETGLKLDLSSYKFF
jgi:hypothetical protein